MRQNGTHYVVNRCRAVGHESPCQTGNVLEQASAGHMRRGFDRIVASDAHPANGIECEFGNSMAAINAKTSANWSRMGKEEVARNLAPRLAATLAR